MPIQVPRVPCGLPDGSIPDAAIWRAVGRLGTARGIFFDVSARSRESLPSSLSCRRSQRGGTTIGILIGIVLGLAIAVATALFVTKTTLPFVGQSVRSADKPGVTAPVPATAAVPEAPKPQVPVADGDVPDPNRTAATRQRAAPGQAPLERREIATVNAAPPPLPQPAPSAQVGVPSAAAATVRRDRRAAAATLRRRYARATPSVPAAASGPVPAPQASVATAERGATYLLQAGAFRGVDDADAMKLRLALMGLEAQVVTAEISGTTLYRVRVGPYTGLDAMTRARARLAENGVEATVVRQR